MVYRLEREGATVRREWSSRSTKSEVDLPFKPRYVWLEGALVSSCLHHCQVKTERKQTVNYSSTKFHDIKIITKFH